MTKTEIEHTCRILNRVPSEDIEMDWGYKNAVRSQILEEPKTIPQSVDLRENWWKIGDQINTGSCVGWATADAVIRWHMVKAGKLSPQDRLSVRFQWMAAKEVDHESTPTTCLEMVGTSLKAALDIARKYGSIPETQLPFDPEKLSHMKPKDFYALASKYKIANYFNLRKPSYKWKDVINYWKTWLAINGPILTGLNVDDTWDNSKDTEGKLSDYHPDTVRGGHAVALVGYTDDYFIVRNSWGTTSWGDEGFGYASMDYARDAFIEAYGVSV